MGTGPVRAGPEHRAPHASTSTLHTGIPFGGEHISSSLIDHHGSGPQLYLSAFPRPGDQPWPEPDRVGGHRSIGSDFLRLWRNGTLDHQCLSGNNVTAFNFPEAPLLSGDNRRPPAFTWVARSPIGYELVGFGIGAGISVRRSKDLAAPFSLYAHPDVSRQHTSYIEGSARQSLANPRYYGRLTIVVLTTPSGPASRSGRQYPIWFATCPLPLHIWDSKLAGILELDKEFQAFHLVFSWRWPTATAFSVSTPLPVRAFPGAKRQFWCVWNGDGSPLCRAFQPPAAPKHPSSVQGASSDQPGVW